MKAQSAVDGAIILPVPIHEVFEFVAHPANDKIWRTEITQTRVHGSPALGALASEKSYLSKRLPNHTLELQCKHWEPPYQVVWETVAGSPYFLRSVRRFEPNGPHTKFIYHITFDRSIVHKAIGIRLPGFLIDLLAKRDMKVYLGNLYAHLVK